jgi:hypothetical protein
MIGFRSFTLTKRAVNSSPEVFLLSLGYYIIYLILNRQVAGVNHALNVAETNHDLQVAGVNPSLHLAEVNQLIII